MKFATKYISRLTSLTLFLGIVVTSNSSLLATTNKNVASVKASTAKTTTKTSVKTTSNTTTKNSTPKTTSTKKSNINSTLNKQNPVKKTTVTKIDAILGYASIVVNGIKIATNDQNNNNVEPVISYNGTTYVPVRAISSALNTNIEWDPKTHTIYIGKKLDADLISINKLNPLENALFKNNGWRNGFFLVNNEKYDVNSSLSSFYKGSATYLLNKKYTELVGQFSIDDSTNANKTAILNIYADDSAEPIFTCSSKFGDKNNPITVDVDITGINKLKIELAGDSSYKEFWNVYLRTALRND